MGILDDAIREHLELKRQHGADESELQDLEKEAFGPAERPEATAPATEAETRVISPGSAITVPAGEGDQLDKVFEAKRLDEAEPVPGDTAESEEVAEHQVPETRQDGPEATAPAAGGDQPTTVMPSSDAAGATLQSEAAEEAAMEAEPAAAEPAVEELPPETGGDAGDALEREREHLSSHPTEHYDVDAAIAEEDELDILSEGSLSDELDRALDGPVAPPGTERADTGPQEPAPAAVGEQEGSEAQEGAPEPELATGEGVDEDDETEFAEAEFFDQDDPLEGTPDFLEETPEHDRLWFEQKEPKDFDFGD